MKNKKHKEEPVKTYGWICPKCGKVNAPFARDCNCNSGVKIVPFPPPQPWQI